jgi:hypothetical protein
MGNTPDLLNIRKSCEHFHRRHTLYRKLRVSNEISTWETLLIQIIFGLKPFKIIGINPLYVIFVRTVRSLKKPFAVYCGYSILEKRTFEQSKVNKDIML